MKYILLPLSLGLVLTVTSLRGQEYSLYQMPDVWNANYLNPGFFPRQQFVLSLPSVHTSLNTIGINDNPLFRYEANNNVLNSNIEAVLNDIDRDFTIRNRSVVDAIGVGFRAGRTFVSFSTHTVAEAQFTLPESLLRTVWEGTEDYLDVPIQMSPTAQMMAYQKVSLGLGYSITPRLSVGLRANRLLGLASLQTLNSGLTLTQSSEYYQTTAELDYRVNYFSGGRLSTIDKTVQGFDNFSDEISGDDLEGNEDIGSFQEINQQNNGWSVDVGAEYLFNDRLTLSASVLNLGAIRWENGTQEVKLTGTATFDGIDIANVEEDDYEILPGIDTIGNFEAASNVGYTQSMPARIYLGANYQVGKKLAVGGLWHHEFNQGQDFSALSLSTRLSLGRIFSLGGIYTFQRGSLNNLGANFALKLGPLQFYTIFDNLSPLMNLERLDGINLRTGFNFTFGRKKSDLTIAQARANADSIKLARERERVATGKAKPSRRRKETAGEEAPQATDFYNNPPSPAKESEAPQPALAAEEEAASSREEEAATAPAGSDKYPLQLEFRDAQTQELMEGVYLDLYRIDQEGERSLLRTTRLEDGKYDLLLPASQDWHLAEVFAHERLPLNIRFQPNQGHDIQRIWYMKRAKPIAEAPPAAEAPAEPEAPAMAETAQAEEPKPQPEPVTQPEAAPAPEQEPEPAPTQSSSNLRPPSPDYVLTKRTSLREAPDAQSRVISRMAVGTELILLEKTNKWWWKVSMGGWEGYAKAALLRKL